MNGLLNKWWCVCVAIFSPIMKIHTKYWCRILAWHLSITKWIFGLDCASSFRRNTFRWQILTRRIERRWLSATAKVQGGTKRGLYPSKLPHRARHCQCPSLFIPIISITHNYIDKSDWKRTKKSRSSPEFFSDERFKIFYTRNELE